MSIFLRSEFLLSDNKAFPWFHSGNIYFRGYYIIDGLFYTGEQALERLLYCWDKDELLESIADLNGFFSLIYETDKEILITTDRLRALPLFYALEDGKVLVSDNAEKLILARPNCAINEIALKEFKMSSLFVAGSKVLFENIYQVEAGQYVLIKLTTLKCKADFYYKYNHDILSHSSLEVKKAEFNRIYYDEVGRDLVSSLNGRMAVVPLSGGADSRMVVSMLKNVGYENVFCFTYGNSKSKEAKISKQVAEYFDYNWFCVEYSKKSWKEIIDNGVYRSYLKRAGNYTSCPHVQDLFAVYYLHKENLLPEDAVFIPGHSGDMLAGSHLTEKFFENEKACQGWVVQRIIDKHYPYFNNKEISLQTLSDTILLNLRKNEEYTIEEAASEYEYFNMIERQAKFICNAVRVYDYFGYEWRMPLWDNRLLEFWSHIPIDLRYKRKLYFYCVGKEDLPSTNDIILRKQLGKFIRTNMSFVTFCARILYRIKEYLFHPFQWGRVVTFQKYFSYVIKYGERFGINAVVMEEYLKLINEDRQK